MTPWDEASVAAVIPPTPIPHLKSTLTAHPRGANRSSGPTAHSSLGCPMATANKEAACASCDAHVVKRAPAH